MQWPCVCHIRVALAIVLVGFQQGPVGSQRGMMFIVFIHSRTPTHPLTHPSARSPTHPPTRTPTRIPSPPTLPPTHPPSGPRSQHPILPVPHHPSPPHTIDKAVFDRNTQYTSSRPAPPHRPPTYLPTHPLTHPPKHSLTHPPTRTPTRIPSRLRGTGWFLRAGLLGRL